MFRNGGSEYAINGNAARLLDIHDLLSDSGIGREMHVIVGQGQLDSILQATPEGRRGFIEEAAGVLKHRKRKEKAVRKLEACEANLNRLSDLIDEIRRQLKPLGRQAEVARKAAIIQAEVRDAKARLLADDLLQATQALQSELADERAMNERRRALEQALDAARAAEVAAEEAVRQGVPRLAAAQETWYSLAALRERVATTLSIARERMRQAEDEPGELLVGRDPGRTGPRGCPGCRPGEGAVESARGEGARRCRLPRLIEAPAKTPSELRRTGWRRSSVRLLTGAKGWPGSPDRSTRCAVVAKQRRPRSAG